MEVTVEVVVLEKEVLKKLPTAGWIPNFFWVEVETIVNLIVTLVIAVIVTVIAGVASVTTAEGVEAVVLEKEALKKLPTAGWNLNFSSEVVVWEAEVAAEAAEIWLTVTLVIAVRTVAKANVTSVAITTTTETTLIVTLVIVAPALLAITSVTSVPITMETTETTEITSAVTLVIVAPALVTASAASVITTTTMADMAVAVQPLTAIPAAVPLSAVKTNVTSVITIMMVGGRHLEQVEAGVLTLETLGDQMGVKIVPEAVVQSILMLEIYVFLEMCELFCLQITIKSVTCFIKLEC